MGDSLEFHSQQFDWSLQSLSCFTGEVNPLLEKSYLDLTLHQRVWILKCLCDNSLVSEARWHKQLNHRYFHIIVTKTYFFVILLVSGEHFIMINFG